MWTLFILFFPSVCLGFLRQVFCSSGWPPLVWVEEACLKFLSSPVALRCWAYSQLFFLFLFCFLCVFPETRSDSVPQADLEVPLILQPQPLKCWDYRHVEFSGEGSLHYLEAYQAYRPGLIWLKALVASRQSRFDS